MSRCKAKTKSGHRCKNNAQVGSPYCVVHSGKVDIKETVITGIGVGIGHAVAPGIGGALVGGLSGILLSKVSNMTKTKVFVSFDFDNDRALKDFIIGQAKLPDSPFEIIDHSLKEAAPEKSWEKKADLAISLCDILVVMVGPYTYRANGVLKEVQMANNHRKKIVQIIGYKNGDYKSVPNAGRLYRWNWENLTNILS